MGDGLRFAIRLPALLLALLSPAHAADHGDFSVETPGASNFSLSPGDKLRVTVSGLGREQFSGDYQVNMNSALEIPYLPPVYVHGVDTSGLEKRLEQALVEEKIFRPGNFRISVQSLEYAPVNVTVAGAVFEPGRIVINDNTDASASKELIVGANPPDRYLTSALLAAGGVTPRADVGAIQIIRESGTQLTVDLSGLFRGERVTDVLLVSGDVIIVPDSGTFQSRIVRPSPITPSEVATYVSNVTEPIVSRSTLESSDRVVNETLFAYGTRLTQAAIAAQCAGGTGINAARKVLYVHTDESTGEITTLERSVNSLMRESALISDGSYHAASQSSPDTPFSQHGINPYLMPRDGIICYDSPVVSLRDLFITAAAILLPVTIWQNIVD
ncbi:MAG: polysaccharide biosynthesis/export family protein [Gammaproteobacteria bacterium]|nr:polysaccharide biosynthesis/export family protein [Gammaproteobacteria bacterium]